MRGLPLLLLVLAACTSDEEARGYLSLAQPDLDRAYVDIAMVDQDGLHVVFQRVEVPPNLVNREVVGRAHFVVLDGPPGQTRGDVILGGGEYTCRIGDDAVRCTDSGGAERVLPRIDVPAVPDLPKD